MCSIEATTAAAAGRRSKTLGASCRTRFFFAPLNPPPWEYVCFPNLAKPCSASQYAPFVLSFFWQLRQQVQRLSETSVLHLSRSADMVWNKEAWRGKKGVHSLENLARRHEILHVSCYLDVVGVQEDMHAVGAGVDNDFLRVRVVQAATLDTAHGVNIEELSNTP